MKLTKAIILAGGLGTRLRPVTLEIPKPLLTVKRQPIINYLIKFLARFGVKDIGLLVHRGHLSDYEWWQKRFKKELPAKIRIFIEEEPSGTFGAVRQLRSWLGNKPFVLSNGDELKDFDLGAIKEFHESHRVKPLATIALVKVDNPSHYGVPVMEGDLIKEFLEKPENPPGDHISSGFYILEPQVFDYADPGKKFLMIEKDIFPKLAAAGKLCGYKVKNGRWFDCGTFERWEKAIKEW